MRTVLLLFAALACQTPVISANAAAAAGDKGDNNSNNNNNNNNIIMAGYKKKVDRRKAERIRNAKDEINKLNDRLVRRNDIQQNKDHGNDNDNDDDDVRQRFHARQKEKRARLDEMHGEVTEKLAAHREGIGRGLLLLSEEELERHSRSLKAFERKKRSLEGESPDKYIERMERHEERTIEKFERKKKRQEERFNRRREDL